METRELLSVDAFADEPLAGVALPVLPDGDSVTDGQLRAVASEVGAPAAVTRREGALHQVPRTGHGAPVAAAVAGAVGAAERGGLDPGAHTLTRADGDPLAVELDDDRTATVAFEQSVEDATVTAEAAAGALGLPAEAITEVDLPVGRADGAGGTVLVPVMYLENLGSIAPGAGALADLLGDAARVFAFTFDTLAADTDVHARVFEPSAGGERAASGVGAAACARYLGTQSAFDGERDAVRVEAGRFPGRPATLDATLDDGRVTGRALLGLAGTVNLPPDEDDDIVTV